MAPAVEAYLSTEAASVATQIGSAADSEELKAGVAAEEAVPILRNSAEVVELDAVEVRSVETAVGEVGRRTMALHLSAEGLVEGQAAEQAEELVEEPVQRASVARVLALVVYREATDPPRHQLLVLWREGLHLWMRAQADLVA